MKLVRGGAGDAVQALEAELAVLSRMHHPRVLLLMGVCVDLPAPPAAYSGQRALVTEWMARGSLHQVLHAQAGAEGAEALWRPETLSQQLQCMLDVAEGMRFLHHAGLVHRDLKSGNVLVDEGGRCKVADFG